MSDQEHSSKSTYMAGIRRNAGPLVIAALMIFGTASFMYASVWVAKQSDFTDTQRAQAEALIEEIGGGKIHVEKPLDESQNYRVEADCGGSTSTMIWWVFADDNGRVGVHPSPPGYPSKNDGKHVSFAIHHDQLDNGAAAEIARRLGDDPWCGQDVQGEV